MGSGMSGGSASFLLFYAVFFALLSIVITRCYCYHRRRLARFSVGVLLMVRFMLPCMLEAGRSFVLLHCTLMYCIVLELVDLYDLPIQSIPVHFHSTHFKASSSGTGTSSSWLGLLEHVSGSFSCDSIRLRSPKSEKATMNAAGSAPPG